jgi:Glycosyl transferase family 2
MSVVPISRRLREETRHPSDVDIVIPVYNEAEQLVASITTLRSYLDSSFPFVTTITIVDNASTDDTWKLAAELAGTLSRVGAIHLDQKGRGRALRAAWSQSSASVVAYMDVDLATDLHALLPLVAPLLSGHSDLAIGSRLAPGAHVVRGTRREIISRGYNLLLRTALRSTCSDAQCGFKALRREAATELLPLVEDNGWFFDTEVLVTAQRIGLRIHEVPVDWVDDLDSRVEVAHTAWMDLRGVWRMLGPGSRRRAVLRSADPVADRSSDSTPRDHESADAKATIRPADGGTGASSQGYGPLPHSPRCVTADAVFADELLRFAGVGAVSTLAYLALFAAMEPGLGTYLANAVAIVLCSLGSTAAHRGIADSARHGLDRPHRILTATALLGISLAFTTGALAATRAVGLTTLVPELLAVTVANFGAAAFRFGILRTWVFRPVFGTHLAPVALTTAAAAGDHQLRAKETTRTPS